MHAQQTQVLIVEDDSLVCELIRSVVEEIGGTVVGIAADGLEAVAMTQQLRPDVVLMDLELPHIDGIEAAQQISECCPTPIVVVTAYDTPTLLQRATQAGAGAYLLKPPSVGDVERAITIAMARFEDMMELRRLNVELRAEIAQRQEAERALRERGRELELLYFASLAFNSTLELDWVLKALMEEVSHILQATASSAWLLNETGELVCRQATGPYGNALRGWCLAPGDGIAGWTVSHGESVIVPDAQVDERYCRDTESCTGLVSRSILSVPLRTKRGTIGTLEVVDIAPGRFGLRHQELLESLAVSAATAIENAQLYAALQQQGGEVGRAGPDGPDVPRLLDLGRKAKK